MRLSPEEYIVKVTGGDQEDTMTIKVSPISETLPEIKAPNVQNVVIKKITNSEHESLGFVKEIRLEEVGESTLITVRRINNTEYSAVLRDLSIREFSISDATIDTIAVLLDKSR